MKKILFATFCLFSIGAFAQQEKATGKPRWKYTGIVQGGLVAGSSEINYSAQTIQGVQKGPWLLGIGAGIDNYLMPGFPVVAHGQFHYGKRRTKPFVYAQAGPHFPWAKNEWNDKIWETDQYELKTGWLAEGGIGYRIPMGKKLKLLTSLGYSIKQTKYDEVQMPWSWLISSRWPPVGGTSDFNYYHQKLTMNRLVLKVGVQF
jgi:hypothetical protein